MAHEIESKRTPSHGPGAAGAGSAVAGQSARAHWVARNEKFLRTILMICAYVFGALCLISIFALGAFAFISGVLLGIVVVSVLAVVVLLKFRRPRR